MRKKSKTAFCSLRDPVRISAEHRARFQLQRPVVAYATDPRHESPSFFKFFESFASH